MFLPWLLLNLASVAGVAGEEMDRGWARQGRRSETLSCQRSIDHADRVNALVTLEVDRSHRPIERRVFLRTAEYDFRWTFPDEGFEPSRRPEEFAPGPVEIPSGTRFPLDVQIRFDGQTVLTRRRTQGNAGFLRLHPPSGRREWSPGVSVHAGRDELPSPVGISRIELVVQAEDGAEIARTSLRVPDWTRLMVELGDAFTAVEAERRGHRCQGSITVSGH